MNSLLFQTAMVIFMQRPVWTVWPLCTCTVENAEDTLTHNRVKERKTGELLWMKHMELKLWSLTAWMVKTLWTIPLSIVFVGWFVYSEDWTTEEIYTKTWGKNVIWVKDETIKVWHRSESGGGSISIKFFLLSLTLWDWVLAEVCTQMIAILIFFLVMASKKVFFQ